MCGIAGIVSKNSALVSEMQLRKATNCLRHRGPESEGVWINAGGTAALGHRRLSIIDLSPEAAQPMQYAHYTIIHNGELYNFPELRKDLEKKGYAFRTHSDTEVIVAAYAAWGPDCLSRFDGMNSLQPIRKKTWKECSGSGTVHLM